MRKLFILLLGGCLVYIVVSLSFSLDQARPPSNLPGKYSILNNSARSLHEGDSPASPVWPATFQADFQEDSYIYFFYTVTSKGSYYYDATNNRSRVDRANGIGDPYCGSVYPLYNTPCIHLIRDHMRHLIFPEYKYCCRCCADSSGCDPPSPTWLWGADYQGIDNIFGSVCKKWKQQTWFNNYYWQALDDMPIRIYQEYRNQITFVKNSFGRPSHFEDCIFDYPRDMDCSQNCYGLCAVSAVGTGERRNLSGNVM